MKKFLLATASMLFFILFISHNIYAKELDAFKGMKGTIRIAGGTAHIPVWEEIAKQIMKSNPDIQISIAGGGSGLGIKQVGEDLIDIGNSGRTPTAEEVSKYNLKVYKWAIDGVGIIVNPRNKVANLSKSQIKDIFAGKISNWKELGGVDKGINLYSRHEDSGTREVFWTEALDKGEVSLKANIVASNGAMKTAIANDPYGIGYISTGYIDETVKAVMFEGTAPDVENILSGKYKIFRSLYSVTKGEPSPLVRALLNYLYSEEGKKIIRSKGFIPAE